MKPLELKRYYVLLALAAGPSHPYGIVCRVREDSNNQVWLSLATLQRILDQFERRTLINYLGVHHRGAQNVSVYELTSAGRNLLAFASGQMEAAVKLAGRRR